MSTNFKIPSEPYPMPVSDDEESFVVLGKSLSDEVDFYDVSDVEPKHSAPVKEAMRLVQEELSKLDEIEASQLKPVEKSPEASANGDTPVDQSFAIGPEKPKEGDSGRSLDISSLNGLSSTLQQLDMTSLIQNNHHPSLGAISIATLSSELSPEEVQSKVESLIEENVNLRNTILQNNLAMKTQYDKIVEWQNDVQKTYQAHKSKFAEAKTYIAKLKAENGILKLEIEQKDDLISKLQEQLENQKKSEISELKTIAANSTILEVEKLKQLNKLYEEEILALKAEKAESLNAKAEKNEECKICAEKLPQQKELLATLNMEADQLVKQLQLEKDRNTEINNKQAELRNEIERLRKLLDDKNASLQEAAENLDRQRKHSAEMEKNLNVEVINLKSQLCLPQPNIKEQLENVRQQLMNSQVIITDLELKNCELNRKLEDNQEKLVEMEEKVNTIDAQKRDEMYALESQLEVYKNDFEAEREARTNTKSEKDQILEDLMNLQRRNQQLQEEIELLRERNSGFEVINPSSRSSTSSAPIPEVSPPLTRYECPVCSRKFRTLRFLEDHVENCLAGPH